MITLSYGYKLPETNDKGSSFFPALEDNITRINSHDHDNSNSKAINITSIANVTQSILPGAWVADGGGVYKQTIVMAGGTSFDDRHISFRAVNGPTGIMYLKAVRLSGTSYEVYINDNTIELLAIYS